MAKLYYGGNCCIYISHYSDILYILFMVLFFSCVGKLESILSIVLILSLVIYCICHLMIVNDGMKSVLNGVIARTLYANYSKS